MCSVGGGGIKERCMQLGEGVESRRVGAGVGGGDGASGNINIEVVSDVAEQLLLRDRVIGEHGAETTKFNVEGEVVIPQG